MTVSEQQHIQPAHRMRWSVVMTAAIKVGSAGLTFLMFVFLARVLEPDAYGQFATMFSLGSFLGFFVLLGQHTRAIKRLSGWIEDRALGLVRGLIVQSLSLVAVAAMALAICVGIAVVVLLALDRQDAVQMLLGALPFVLPFALSELCAAMFRAQGSITLALLPRDIVWRVLVVALCVPLAGQLPYLQAAGALTTMLILSAVLLALTIVQGIVLAWRLPRGVWATPSEGLPRAFWADSAWLWTASLVGIMAGHLSVVFTSFNLSDAETGAFFAAGKIALLLQLPLVAMTLVAGPMLARDFAKSDMAAMQNTCRTMMPLLAGASLVGMIIVCAAPGRLLSLFDPSFTVAVPALIVLTLTQLIAALCGAGTLVMIMSDNERTQTLVVGASELFGLLLIFVLAPVLGLLGAAIAALIGRTLGKVIAALFCFRRLGIDTTVFCLLHPPKRPLA